MAINDLTKLEQKLIGCSLDRQSLIQAFNSMNLPENFADIDPRPLIEQMLTVN